MALVPLNPSNVQTLWYYVTYALLEFESLLAAFAAKMSVSVFELQLLEIPLWEDGDQIEKSIC